VFHYFSCRMPWTSSSRPPKKKFGEIASQIFGKAVYNRLSEDLVSIFSELFGDRKSRTIIGGWDSEELEDVALEVGQLGDEDGLVKGITTNRMALNILEQIDHTAGGGATAGAVLRV
jgi:hypothetical protein